MKSFIALLAFMFLQNSNALAVLRTSAQDGGDLQKDGQFALENIFAKVNSQQPLCFGREYSPKELEERPLQTVKKLRAKFSTEDAYQTQILELELTLKDQPHKNYTAYMTCQNGLGSCMVDCDGGRVYLKMLSAGTSKEQLQIINKGFVAEGGCDEEAETVFIHATQGGDDVFNTSPLPSAFCQSN